MATFFQSVVMTEVRANNICATSKLSVSTLRSKDRCVRTGGLCQLTTHPMAARKTQDITIHYKRGGHYMAESKYNHNKTTSIMPLSLKQNKK